MRSRRIRFLLELQICRTSRGMKIPSCTAGSKEAPYDPPVHSPVGMRRLFRVILRNIYIPFIAIGKKMDYTRCITRKERHPPWKKTA